MANFLTVSEAARELDVAAQTIRTWADSGMLPNARTAGGQRIFQRADIDRFLAARVAEKASR